VIWFSKLWQILQTTIYKMQSTMLALQRTNPCLNWIAERPVLADPPQSFQPLQ